MEHIISKELLSEVFGVDITNIVTDNKKIRKSLNGGASENEIAFSHSSRWHYINIYELAHKCKERAVKEGYTLIEYPFAVELYNEKLVLRCCKITDKTTILYCPSRVFKACQWILDNKEQQ